MLSSVSLKMIFRTREKIWYTALDSIQLLTCFVDLTGGMSFLEWHNLLSIAFECFYKLFMNGSCSIFFRLIQKAMLHQNDCRTCCDVGNLVMQRKWHEVMMLCSSKETALFRIHEKTLNKTSQNINGMF